MLGADVMFRETGEVVLIEINDTPGLTWLKNFPEGDKYANEITDFIFNQSVVPVFDGNIIDNPNEIILVKK